MRGERVNKSIAIIGEGETEWFYFESLRIAKRFPIKIAPDFPSHSDLGHLLSLCERYLAKQYDYVICLVDMDRLKQIPVEMSKYQSAKQGRRYKKVIFIETNPCTEFWFLLHFLPDLHKRKYNSYEELLPELRKHMSGYEKTQKYFRRTDLYNFLERHGDIESAVRNSKILSALSKSDEDGEICYSEIYKVIELVDSLNH